LVPTAPPAPNIPETPKVRSVQLVPTAPPAPNLPATPRTPAGHVVPTTPPPPATRKPPAPPRPQAGKLDRLVDVLIAAKKSDADILDFITIDVLGRLPTDAEKKLTLGLVSKAADRKAAWLEVAKALAATGEGKQRSDAARGVIVGDLDVDVIEVTGTIETSGDSVHLRVKPNVDPEVRPELKPRTNPEVKSRPPAKK